MILIYTDNITSRHQYIFELIFKYLLGYPYKITSNIDEFSNYQGVKIYYSAQEPLKNYFWIYDSRFLSKNGIEPFQPDYSLINNIPVLFPSACDDATGFDIFAAAFYMVSRYEEYLPFKHDKYHRFASHSGIGGKYDFFDKPVVHFWVKLLAAKLNNRFGTIHFKPPEYERTITFDIDSAMAFRHKGFYREVMSIGRSLIHFRFNDLIYKFLVHLRIKDDPFDTFQLISKYAHKYKFKPLFFFLLGDYSRFDRNISPRHRSMKKLIKKLSKNYPVGIHPSFKSNYHPELLHTEINRLKRITGNKVKKSRQHYLKITLPFTYQNLIRLGIEEDYSMGFADKPGFRAGIAVPFYFYDLTKESKTKLMVYPFQLMDATLKRYMKLNKEQAIEKIQEMILSVKEINGRLIVIWHNESLSDWNEWKGWRSVFVYLAENSA